MAETNPRSKLHSMKRQYFLVTFLLAISLFLVVYLPMEILFTIFEAGPYVRLGIIVALFVLDYIAVNLIVNKKLQSRWVREASPMLDTIQAPEPEYIMDEETARKIEETQRMEALKKNNSFFSRLYRSLAPTEDPEEELHPTSELTTTELDKKMDNSAKPKHRTEQKAEFKKKGQPSKTEAKPEPRTSKLRRKRSRQEGSQQKPVVPETVPTGSSWQTKVEDMKTADYDDVVKALKDAGETVEPIKETGSSKETSEPQRRVPSRRRRRQEQEAAEAKREAPRKPQRDASADESANAAEPKKKQTNSEQAKRRHHHSGSEKDTAGSRNDRRNEKRTDVRKKRKKSSSNADSKRNAKQVSPASNWSTPLEEMKTEELETAVEKALRQGYNPISNERNK